jgi:radical SAM protein with 4Fe4S-binding SPASM domain
MASTLQHLPLIGDAPRPNPLGARSRMPSVSTPEHLQVEITSSCNLKCIMCPLTLGATLSSHNVGHMRDMVWEEVLQAARIVTSVCLVGYGEPTTNPKFLEMLRELDHVGVGVMFTTNAYSIRPDFVKEVAKLRNLKRVNISIDSPDPDVYRDIRKGELSRVWDGLRLLTTGLPPRVLVAVSTVVMANNVRTLTAFPKLLHDVGVKHFELGGMYDLTASIPGQQINDEDFNEHIATIRAECQEYGIDVVSDYTLFEFQATEPFYLGNVGEPGHQTKQCLLPWTIPYVDKNGDVFPCCYAAIDKPSVMGNLKDAPLAEIWEGETFRKFRADLLHGDAMPGICYSCTKPMGQHPLTDYAARLLLDESRLSGGTAMELVVLNSGLLPWRQELPIEIRPFRNRCSEHYHPTWLAPNRVCKMVENEVRPGEKATFRFEATPIFGDERARFQLAFEDTFLPHTVFEINPQWDSGVTIREVPLTLRPVLIHDLVWKDGLVEGTGDDPYIMFSLEKPLSVKAVRLRCTFGNKGARSHFHMYWRRRDNQLYTEKERVFRRDVFPDPGEQTLTIGVNSTIDELRIDPDNKPSSFRLDEVVLLVADGNGATT